jgi:hypothetical protein
MRPQGLKMRSIVLALAIVCVAGAARAQIVYSFEDGTIDGFFGVGATTTEDTIGATEGTKSMKYAANPDDGFVGARTQTVIPAALNDPPGVTAVLFDMTIVDRYAGGFADIGVTVFGDALNAPGGPQLGLQVQFGGPGGTVRIAGEPAGTYLNEQISLNVSMGPYRPGESFNDIFGPGDNDLTQASAFQFFISKNVGIPVTVYIDNVRLIPEPVALSLMGIGAMALASARVQRVD